MELNYDNFYSFNNSPFHQNYEENGIFTSKSPANFEDGLYIFDNQNLNYFQQFTGVSSQQKNFELSKEFLMSFSPKINLENGGYLSNIPTKNNSLSVQPTPQNLICKECGTSFQQTDEEAYYSHFNHCVKSALQQYENLNSLNTQTSKDKEFPKPVVNCSSLPVRVQCNLCGRKLFQHNLAVHNRIHTGEMPFNCEFCFRPFRTKSALNVHFRSHTGERPYNCPFCCYACITKPNLKRHITNKHDKATGRTFKLCAIRNWR
uniref:C2H2-type domain-containing protein n=1 Tax=Meloidogyne enterolobii TaxID=390850 RepID=A0A6V7V4R6_MELEN|nr:unnamed protein product [Meloidogyne enterolobii]